MSCRVNAVHHYDWLYHGNTGIKSIKFNCKKSVFVEKQPETSWNILQPREYGFYSNVNPEVSHPRWSQARERRLTTGGLASLFSAQGKDPGSSTVTRNRWHLCTAVWISGNSIDSITIQAF